jgi:hypothetical protein
MPGVSRRTFLSRGSVAVAVGGAAAAIPGIGSLLQAAPAEAPEINGALSDAETGAADANGPLVAHVTDLRSGEIKLYQGVKQVSFRDPSVAAHLSRTISAKGN